MESEAIKTVKELNRIAATAHKNNNAINNLRSSSSNNEIGYDDNDYDDVIRSENNTLIFASFFDKDNLTTSILQPLPISIIKLDDSYASSIHLLLLL